MKPKMKVLLIYFSGTGMTRYYASLIREEIESRGHLCDCREIEELVDLPSLWRKNPVSLSYTLRADAVRPLDLSFNYQSVGTALQSINEEPELLYLKQVLSAYDLLGVGSPVYEFQPAPVIIRFLLDLPFFSGTLPVFSFATHDGAQGDFAAFIKRLLQSKGFTYLGHLDQSFILSTWLIFRRQYDPVRAGERLVRKTEKAKKKIRAALDRFGLTPNGTNPLPGKTPRAALLQLFPLRLLYSWMMRLLLSYLFFGFGLDRNGCLKCYTCIRQCPQGLIGKDNRGFPVRRYHCMYCLRCLNWCPTGTLYFSRRTRNRARFPGPEALLEAAREHHPERWVVKKQR